MFSVFINFSETHFAKVGLDVRISLVKVLSTGRGRKLPPPPKKKKEKAISNTDLL